jgi:hypothetical protein
MRAVLALHAMGVKNQVVAHPDGVEAVAFGHVRAAYQEVARSALAEMRQK